MNTPNWAKSSYSNSQGNCPNWRFTPYGVELRDDKLGDKSPILSFTFDEWACFIAAVKDGEADLRPILDPSAVDTPWQGPKAVKS